MPTTNVWNIDGVEYHVDFPTDDEYAIWSRVEHMRAVDTILNVVTRLAAEGKLPVLPALAQIHEAAELYLEYEGLDTRLWRENALLALDDAMPHLDLGYRRAFDLKKP